MKTFSYTITDEIGIHARPAGMLAKKVKEFQSIVTIFNGEKSAVATKIMAVMGLGVKEGNEIKITVEGPDEDVAVVAVEKFLKENL